MTSGARARVTKQVRATQPNCHLCGRYIDQSLDSQRDPLGYVVDEIIPRSFGGSCVDVSNCRAAHRICNQWRGDRPVDGLNVMELERYLSDKGVVGKRKTTGSRTW